MEPSYALETVFIPVCRECTAKRHQIALMFPTVKTFTYAIDIHHTNDRLNFYFSRLKIFILLGFGVITHIKIRRLKKDIDPFSLECGIFYRGGHRERSQVIMNDSVQVPPRDVKTLLRFPRAENALASNLATSQCRRIFIATYFGQVSFVYNSTTRTLSGFHCSISLILYRC